MGSAQDNWLINLRDLVDEHAEGEDKRPGYRYVAVESGLSEEYVYQLYNGLPKDDGTPRRVGVQAARKLARRFAHGRSLDWIDMHPSERLKAGEPAPTAPGYVDSKAMTDSEWQTLQDLRVLPEPEREALKRDLRSRAKVFKAYADEVLERAKRHDETGKA